MDLLKANVMMIFFFFLQDVNFKGGEQLQKEDSVQFKIKSNKRGENAIKIRKVNDMGKD